MHERADFMKRIVILILLIVFSNIVSAQKYIFFLHNSFIEMAGAEAVHPEYGKAEYNEIIKAFKEAGFNVISEVRAKNTDVKEYAKKTVKQMDSLIHKGVKPGDITVIGTSKGGQIAMYVSGYLKNKDANFVFIGCCGEEGSDAKPEINFCGNVLSIREKSDVGIGSCLQLKDKSVNKVGHFKEIELNTGLKHGFLFKALPDWIRPCVAWANGNYN
jgi:hypothetical protein